MRQRTSREQHAGSKKKPTGKWFNAEKGYGFNTVDGGRHDVFEVGSGSTGPQGESVRLS